jgi:hypothetical protein
MSDTYVFLGPSLPVADAVRVLPGAVYLPPVAVGDVYALVRDVRPRRIAIVDGYFERMAAVWHKEILWALEHGVAVSGAASMGALRAAELRSFGMTGVGRVYAAYARGRLVADDEVAIVHGPAEMGYVAMSTAMVDLRAGLATAVRRGAITARSGDRLIELGRAMFYRDRSWESLIGAAAGAVPARQRAALAALVAAGLPSQKAADARALLRQLAGERRARPGARPGTRQAKPRWTMERTWFWDRFVEIYDDGS